LEEAVDLSYDRLLMNEGYLNFLKLYTKITLTLPLPPPPPPPTLPPPPSPTTTNTTTTSTTLHYGSKLGIDTELYTYSNSCCIVSKH
jgi:hypothetical protein